MTQVNSCLLYGRSVVLLGLSAVVVSVAPAWAGVGVPAPLAGAAGPVGLLAAAAVYGGYLLVKYFRNRR